MTRAPPAPIMKVVMRAPALLGLMALMCTAGVLSAQNPPVPSSQVLFKGTVKEHGTERSIARAAIVLNGRAVAFTDESGAFVVRDVAVYAVDNKLEVRALGYDVAQRIFDFEGSETELVVNVLLDRSATELPPVVVEDVAISPHLRGFEQRRRAEAGHFLTAQEIAALNPATTTGILRRIPTVDVLGDAETGTIIRIHTAGYLCNAVEGYRPAVFVDGVLTPNVDLDAVLQPERIAGIEVYRGAARVPPEFNVGGSAGARGRMTAQCGVIAFWTKAPEPGEVASPFELGFRYGGALGAGDFASGRVGVHLVTPFVGPLEFYPALNVFINAPSPGEGLKHSGWQAQVAFRIWPLQRKIPWTLGTGLVLAKRTVSTEEVPVDTTLELADVDAQPTVFTCFCVSLGPTTSFAEIHVVDLGSDPKVQLFFGFGVRFYSRQRQN